MCGRYALVLSKEIDDLPFVEESSHLELELPWESYNIAPTQKVPILDRDCSLKLSTWGLIPHWSKQPPKRPLINSRLETAADKPSFRTAYKHHRCAVPAIGFFEWERLGKRSLPYFIPPPKGKLLWLAGLASYWDSPELGSLLTHCLLTRDSGATPLESLHHRCPVTLEENSIRGWLQGEVGADTLLSGTNFGVPYRVSDAVNKASWDDPSNIEALS